MAVSPLAQIDWTNLGSADLPLAVNLLAVATQERFNIATVRRSGGIRAGFNAGDRNHFPYKSNGPSDWTLNSGDPLGDFTDQVETLLSDMIKLFADVEKWDDAATDQETTDTVYVLSGAADDSGTYANRLFEVTGYTSYPDLSVYAAEEVKKWYDMISECTTIVRKSGLDNDDYFIYDGVFDVEADALYNANIDGAEYFTAQANPKDFPRTELPDNSVYAAFDTANTALFGTAPDRFDESTDTGTTPPDRTGGPRFYEMQASVAKSPDPYEYTSWLRAWTVSYVADWEDSMSAIGFTGKPLSYANQLRIIHGTSLSNCSFIPVITYPASTTANSQRYYTSNVVTRSGDKDIIAVDPKLSPVTVPATAAALSDAWDTSNNQGISLGHVIGVDESFGDLGFSDTQFLELWNGEGGFDYYTVPIPEVNEGQTDTTIQVEHDFPNPVLFEMGDDVDGDLFEVNGIGEVVFIAPPDFDAPGDVGGDNTYTFAVTVTDTVTDETLRQVFSVSVNSLTPVFSDYGPFTIDNPEDTQPALKVYVNPFDTLVLEGPDAALFELDGVFLQLINPPDFEAPGDVGGDNVYNVTVRATQDAKEATQAYVFTVTDILDTLPFFAAPFSASVAENQTSAITITVDDAASLVLEGADEALFDITGSVITFLVAPDFENPGDVGANNVYNFDVRATNVLGDTVQPYTITVTNVVESVTFTGPFTFNVEENQTGAFTADVVGDVPITFALSGVDSALFTVDVAGVVTFLVAPDFDLPGDVGGDNIHNITVEATNVTGMTPQPYTVTVEEEGAILDEIGVEIAGDDHLVATWSWTDPAVTKDWFGVTWANGESKIIHDQLYPYQSEYFDRYDSGDSIYWREFFFGDYAGLSGADGAYFEYVTPVGDTALITWTTNTMTVVRTPSIT
jgi:hypothetical protein